MKECRAGRLMLRCENSCSVVRRLGAVAMSES